MAKWDESKHPRGKTSKASTPGSFAPVGSRAYIQHPEFGQVQETVVSVGSKHVVTASKGLLDPRTYKHPVHLTVTPKSKVQPLVGAGFLKVTPSMKAAATKLLKKAK